MLLAGQHQVRPKPASASGGEIGCEGTFAGAAQAFGVGNKHCPYRFASKTDPLRIR
jgi:hypothetical protein